MTANNGTPAHERRHRRSDFWLAGFCAFLLGIVISVAFIGFTAISRQSRATCYQLTSIERGIAREQGLADKAKTSGERELHLKSVADLQSYASGLRAIVPGCQRPAPMPQPIS